MRSFSSDSILLLLETHSIKLVTALAILFFGWLLALIAAAVIRKGLARIKLEKLIGRITFFDEMGKTIPIERWIARAIFYLLMLFVFVAFFEVLGLKLINDPLNKFLTQLFAYAPNLIPSVILLFLAWIMATVLRMVVIQVIGNTKITSILSERADIEEEYRASFVRTMGNTVYWVVFLIFSLAILESLKLEGLLGPLQKMMDSIMSYLPRILGALLLFALGWFFARVVQRIVANLLVTLGTDHLSQQAGLKSVLGKQDLSYLLSMVIYIFILIPVLIASLDTLELESITKPASGMLNSSLAALPSLFAAFLVIFVAFLVGRLLSGLVTNLLSGAGFNKIPVKMGLMQYVEEVEVGKPGFEGRKKTPSEILGSLVLMLILLFAAIEALNLIGFDSLSQLLIRFTQFLGQVLLGLVIVGVGLWISNLVANAIMTSETFHTKFFSAISRVAILGLSCAMGLREMGLANEIITVAFGMIVGSVAVAVAVSFGIGGREIAEQFLKDWVKNFKPSKK